MGKVWTSVLDFVHKTQGSFRVLRVLLFSSFLFLVSYLIYPQSYAPSNPISPPQIPTVPAISPPSISPITPVSPVVGPKQSDKKTETTSQQASSTSQANTNETSKKTSLSALSLLGLGTNDALLSAFTGTDASDTNINLLSSLLGLDSIAGSGTTTLNTQKSDSEQLAKIIELLEQKVDQVNRVGIESNGTENATANSLTGATTGASANTSATGLVDSSGSVNAIQTRAEILRFSVNGYSLLPSFTTVFASIPAKDNSFIITGDRAFYASNMLLTETFYFLIRPQKNSESHSKLFWDLTAELDQYPENPNSYIYQLKNRSSITGTQTGDLLIFRSQDPAWNLDLVVRLGE